MVSSQRFNSILCPLDLLKHSDGKVAALRVSFSAYMDEQSTFAWNHEIPGIRCSSAGYGGTLEIGRHQTQSGRTAPTASTVKTENAADNPQKAFIEL